MAQYQFIYGIIIQLQLLMGNSECNQCNNLSQLTPQASISTIRVAYESYTKPQQKNYQQPLLQDPSQSRLMLLQNSLSKIKVKEKKILSFQILDTALHPTKMEVDLRDTDKNLRKFNDQNRRYNMACVEFGSKIGETILNIVFIDIVQDSSMYIVVFAGVQKDKKRERGMYFLIKPKEVVIFNGVFGDKNVGLKITKTEEIQEKHWGEFNQKFQAQGKGLAIIVTRRQEGAEQQHFSGNFVNGKRQGKGNTKILFNTQNDDYDKLFSSSKLPNIQSQLVSKNRDIKKMTDDITTFINIASLYNPLPPQPQPNSYFDLLISSTWSNNQIEGITQQFWPSKNIRFQGMYQNNQRNGYGEQYSYDQVMAKGFYKNGIMQTHKDNQYLLMGFKMVDGQWIRSKPI